ncbi:uncharacterized protein LOC121737557 [Aricia agestis]|uniref:uncharacterized protein LOC121737557 n=1 Tax=Aricia agestis TaxID=91739 RepID=UPI001C201FF5|nr:uncharacterized protein LOC121737557 [Aricia agestis]
MTKAGLTGASKASQRPKPTRRPRRRRNAAPTAAAVVVTLQHDAVERGANYKDVIERARQQINLADLGLTEGVRCRQAATGARIMELPSTATSEMADRFAEKLRGVLAGIARVARPVKCSDVRISGLDDSVTKEDVMAAVITKTGCSSEHVKGGDIRTGPGGTGSIWVQCPVAAANTLVAAGRLLVGWSSARIQLLEPRAMKCYRCLELGHTARRCQSEVDRGQLCYRCGQAGHKASDCSAKPHCVVCSAAGRNPNHTAGGKGCVPPKKGRKRGGKPQATGRPQARQEELMETNNG